jgi:glycosyltransferase involved in cell wall biosynthesis
MSPTRDDRTRPISVCALVPYPVNSAPSQRFRLEQWRPYLREQGIAVEFHPFVDDALMALLHRPGRPGRKAASLVRAFLRRALALGAVRNYDVVVIHRALCILGPAVLERMLPLFGKPVIFDFDDAIWLLHTTHANRHFGWLKFPGKTAAICRLSTHVVVGNAWLADYARRSNPHVTVIPSSIDIERFRPVSKRLTSGRTVVGWTGSGTSQTYLEMFAPVLARLHQTCDFELRVISDRWPEITAPPFEWRPWSAQTEVLELEQFDIGIMPMPDDKWAHGKCAFKALQTMAMGIPTVCSAVGMNRELVQHGTNGLLAATEEDWLDHLRSLIEDPALRERLGTAGRRTVEESYSMEQSADRFARVIRETLETHSTRVRRSPAWSSGRGSSVKEPIVRSGVTE